MLKFKLITALTGAFIQPRSYPVRNSISLPAVIISDVEARFGLRRNDIGGGIADIAAEDSQNVQQVVRGGVAVFEQIVLDEDVVVVVWPMS